MARLGGLSPVPFRLGGGPSRAAQVFASLNAQMGEAYAFEDRNSIAYARNLAMARMVASGWSTAGRVATLRDPVRTVDVSRWERMLKLKVGDTDSLAKRRQRLVDLRAREGKPITQDVLADALQDALADIFVAVEFISVSLAVVHVPDGTYPWGTVADGAPWYSTVAHALVLVQKPSSMTEAQFYDRAGLVHAVLDPLLTSWSTFDWYRAPETGVAVSVAGGPSAAGFYLDERNLDNSVFDV